MVYISSILDIMRISNMPRIKFKPSNKIAFDKAPVQFKVLPGVRERLKDIPNWQDKLRDYVDELIKDVDK
jgi:hypothetical protein